MLYVCTHVPGSAAHALGRAAAATGDLAAATAHFEDAIAFEEGLGARVLAARSRAARAALARRARPVCSPRHATAPARHHWPNIDRVDSRVDTVVRGATNCRVGAQPLGGTPASS
jgi:hypothetical protein